MTFGLKPLRIRGGQPNSNSINEYKIENGVAAAIYTGDPVKLSAGNLQVATNTDTIFGVFQGTRYIDANGQVAEKAYIAASTSSGGLIEGFNHPLGKVVDDPDATFLIEADSSISAGHLGLNFKVSDSGGATHAGLSGIQLHVSSATVCVAGTMCRLVRLHPEPGNDLGDSNPLVEIELVNTRPHAKD